MAEQRLVQVKPTLEKKRSELARAPRHSDTDEQRRQQLERDIVRAQQQLSEINYDGRVLEELGQRKHNLGFEKQDLDAQLYTFESRSALALWEYARTGPKSKVAQNASGTASSN